ncbi:DUF5616 domain-containing protein [Lachnospiraceae bacterium MD308]|nr:DUF5616 domain-containing protein [Lachnospiraceae bacterium MD308]
MSRIEQDSVRLLLGHIELLGISKAVFYLDAPVPNSGRLSGLIRECSHEYNISVQTQIIPDVDHIFFAKILAWKK